MWAAAVCTLALTPARLCCCCRGMAGLPQIPTWVRATGPPAGLADDALRPRRPRPVPLHPRPHNVHGADVHTGLFSFDPEPHATPPPPPPLSRRFQRPSRAGMLALALQEQGAVARRRRVQCIYPGSKMLASVAPRARGIGLGWGRGWGVHHRSWCGSPGSKGNSSAPSARTTRRTSCSSAQRRGA